MLDNTFQLLPWTNIMSYSRENNDFSGMQIWNFPLQCQLESQPDNCFKSPMPKFQSWSILVTNLRRGYLRTNASPMLNLQSCPMVICSYAGFPVPHWSSWGFSGQVLTYTLLYCTPKYGFMQHLASQSLNTPQFGKIFITPSISNIIW